MNGGSLALGLYRGVSRLATPLAPALLRHRVARGKEDPARLGERLGCPSQPRPAGGLVWLHGASVGEFNAALPVVVRLIDSGRQVLVTTGTVTSARLARERLPEGALHQFVPVDAPAAVDRFLDHWRPDLALFVESELWPNLVAGVARRGIPAALVNARLSERSARRWRRLPRMIGDLLGPMRVVLAQTAEDAARFRALGSGSTMVAGNLKRDAAPLPADGAALAVLAAALGDRPVWLAASTHSGEEELVAEAHALLEPELPGLLTVVVPRHPERGAAAAEALGARGLAAPRRSGGALPAMTDGTYVADTLGELGLFYRLARVAFLGGSLVPHGGQNPIEALRLGCPVLHGPHVHNFAALYDALDATGGTEPVADAAALARAVADHVRDGERRSRAVTAGLAVLDAGDSPLAITWAAIEPLLPPVVAG